MVAIASDGELVLGSMASLIASPSKLFCSDMGDSRRSTVLQNATNRFPVRPRVPCFQFHGARPINLYAVKPPNPNSRPVSVRIAPRCSRTLKRVFVHKRRESDEA